MKQHPLCTDPDNGPTVMDLPIAQGMKSEWAELETRRHFLGKAGKVLGWAAWPAWRRPDSYRECARRKCRALAGEPSPAQLCSQGQASDLPVYVRRAAADGPAGLQAQSGPALRQRHAGLRPRGAATHRHDRGPGALSIAPSHWAFKRYGKSGAWVSDLLPYTARMVDDLTIIKSTNTDAINHEPAIMLLNTGNMNAGKPCLGSWLSYGLGSMNDNLPTFMVLLSKLNPKENNQPVSSRLWSSGFLSSEYAGVGLRSAGDPVLYLSDPKGVDRDVRRKMLDAVNEINHQTYQELGDPETNARISQYEMAYRMQASVPELTDMSKEPQSTWDLYGPDAKEPGTYAYNCLMARRMAERGVRFTQIYKRGWDVHENVTGVLPILCQETDRASYALVTDLKQRGLLDDTLVIWAGNLAARFIARAA